LKENHLVKIKEPIAKFIAKETYKAYNKHGIPYKMNIMLHGAPGVGKTSLIHSIASECGANLCVLNINAELKEEAMIEAISQVNEDDKRSILVLEDIDCIFVDRKANDSMKNNITMNGILNCLDGFNNPEGLIVIMSTNFPDKLDDALMRSGRIDLDVELTYLDKYQTRNMFLSFFNSIDRYLYAELIRFITSKTKFLSDLNSKDANSKTRAIFRQLIRYNKKSLSALNLSEAYLKDS
jgi:chaperone BCS1